MRKSSDVDILEKLGYFDGSYNTFELFSDEKLYEEQRIKLKIEYSEVSAKNKLDLEFDLGINNEGDYIKHFILIRYKVAKIKKDKKRRR